jgi:hypothetical protein
MKKFVKENSLSLFFLAIFLLALVGQAIAGHNLYNEEAVAHKEATISFWHGVKARRRPDLRRDRQGGLGRRSGGAPRAPADEAGARDPIPQADPHI